MAQKQLEGQELDQIEGQYLNLANYSSRLITAGKESKKHGNNGIYYSIKISKDPMDEFEEEALESIVKRRAIIKRIPGISIE